METTKIITRQITKTAINKNKFTQTITIFYTKNTHSNIQCQKKQTNKKHYSYINTFQPNRMP